MTRPDLTLTEADVSNAYEPVGCANGLVTKLSEQIAAVEVACVVPQQTISAFRKARFIKFSWPALFGTRMSCNGQENWIERKVTARILENSNFKRTFAPEISVFMGLRS